MSHEYDVLVSQQSARQGAPTEHEVLRDFQQGLAHKRQAEGGSDDAVMQSAVSVCEGALGILKAALAGALTGTQNVCPLVNVKRGRMSTPDFRRLNKYA